MKKFLILFSMLSLSLHAQEEFQRKRRVAIGSFTSLKSDYMGQAVGFDLEVGLKFGDIWIESSLSFSSGSFHAVSSNSTNVESRYSEGFFLRDDEVTFDAQAVGLGLSLESYLLDEMFGFSNWFESSTAYITYNIFEDSLRGQARYGGAGIKFEYALNYLLSQSAALGLRFSYDFSPLKRSPEFAEERSDGRSLLLHFLGVGLELSYFF